MTFSVNWDDEHKGKKLNSQVLKIMDFVCDGVAKSLTESFTSDSIRKMAQEEDVLRREQEERAHRSSVAMQRAAVAAAATQPQMIHHQSLGNSLTPSYAAHVSSPQPDVLFNAVAFTDGAFIGEGHLSADAIVDDGGNLAIVGSDRSECNKQGEENEGISIARLRRIMGYWIWGLGILASCLVGVIVYLILR